MIHEKNMESIGEDTPSNNEHAATNCHFFMCYLHRDMQHGGSAVEEDPPGTSIGQNQEAAHASGSGSSSTNNAVPAHGAVPVAPRSSVPTDSVVSHIDPVVQNVAAQGDPTTGDHALPLMPTETVRETATTEILPSGSSTATAPAAPPTSSWPTTRLSQGITCPKRRTDGTVRWGMSATTSEEPASIEKLSKTQIGAQP